LHRCGGGSVEFALALGRPLVVEPGGAAFALRTLLSLGGTPFMFRRAFAFKLGLVVFLRRSDGVGLGFLAMSGDLTAKALTLMFALAAPRNQSSACEQQKRDHDHDNGDYGNS
jgi:hypothetical protein